MIINLNDFGGKGGGGGDITVDSQMSDTSTNPVQNKVIKAYVDSHSGGGKPMVLLNDDWSGEGYYEQRKELFDSLSAWTETHEVGKEEIPFTVVWGHDFAKEIGETSYVKPVAVTTRAGVRQDFIFVTDTKVIVVYINENYEWSKMEAEYRQW